MIFYFLTNPMSQFLKTIHPENRSELAEADLKALQKDLIMYMNDLSDEHITAAVNYFASQQHTSRGAKQKNPLRKWIESTRSWKYHLEDKKLGEQIKKENKKRYEKAIQLRKQWGIS